MVDFEVQDFVDVLSLDCNWEVGRIDAVNAKLGYLVSYIGVILDDTEWVKAPRLRPFRIKTTGDSWPCFPLPISPEDVSHSMASLSWLFATDLSDSLPAKSLIAEYRGKLFFLATSILETAPSSAEECREWFDLLSACVQLLYWWMNFTRDHLDLMQQITENPEEAYSSVESALVSMWPEVFEIFRVLMKVDEKATELIFENVNAPTERIHERTAITV